MNGKKIRIFRIAVYTAIAFSVIYALFCGYAVMMRTVHSVTQSRVEQIANEAIHFAISSAVSECGKYGELTEVYRSPDGKVQSVTLNGYAVNSLKSDISVKVLEYLDDEDRYIVAVPLGNFFGSEFLTGIGPRVKFRIVPFDIVAVDFVSKFIPAGINQVLHRVTVKVEVKISAILPGFEGISDVSSSAVISETVIIGDVPDTYFNRGS